MTDFQIRWAVWCCCAAVGVACIGYSVFESIRERRRAKKRRAELDAMWERFFHHVGVLEGPEEVAKYQMRRALIG